MLDAARKLQLQHLADKPHFLEDESGNRVRFRRREQFATLPARNDCAPLRLHAKRTGERSDSAMQELGTPLPCFIVEARPCHARRINFTMAVIAVTAAQAEA